MSLHKSAWHHIALFGSIIALCASPLLSSSQSTLSFQLKPQAVQISHSGGSFPVSLNPELEIGNLKAKLFPIVDKVKFDLFSGKAIEIPCSRVILDNAELDAKIVLKWSKKENVLRKWVRLRQTKGEQILLKEVVLDDIPGAPSPLADSPVQPSDGKVRVISDAGLQSYPIFVEGFFLGVEFPIASTRFVENRLILAHKPAVRLVPGKAYESRKAVYGIAEKGEEKQRFIDYISSNMPENKNPHINYNSWWTSSAIYSENEIISLIEVIEKNLKKPYGASFDTFCINLDWPEIKNLLGKSEKTFIDGFEKIRRAAANINSKLGISISPDDLYYPATVDNLWFEKQKQEAFKKKWVGGAPIRRICLGELKYSADFARILVEMATKWGVRHFKFDGYNFTCPKADHGHEPGELSAEAIADGIIKSFIALRKAAPDAWLETTCFWWNPSPWWLFYVNSVIGTYGDDAPMGRVPCPIYRESYTTARDYFNIQGAIWLPIPIAAQEVLGIIHQSNEPFHNDAITAIMRGHKFLPVYLNPGFMNASRWRDFANIIKWARKNASILSETIVLLPESWQGGKVPKFTPLEKMPREPYGYAHWSGNKGLVMIRNPWIKPVDYSLRLDSDMGLAKGISGLVAMSIYPETRLYGQGLKYGDTLHVPLAPYETLVLSISKQTAGNIPSAGDVLRKRISGNIEVSHVKEIEYIGSNESYGSDWTSLVGDSRGGIEMRLAGEVIIDAPKSELLILIESDKKIEVPELRIKINDAECDYEISSSETGWAASLEIKPENWLFLRVPLREVKNKIDASVLMHDESVSISAWVWAYKNNDDMSSVDPEMLPGPELISLDALELMSTFTPNKMRLDKETRERPIEKINGIYFDALEPHSITEGWGSLQKKKSEWENPITVGNRRFLVG